jgi:hypothetical protein
VVKDHCKKQNVLIVVRALRDAVRMQSLAGWGARRWKWLVFGLLSIAECSSVSPDEERAHACGAYATEGCRLLQKCRPEAFDVIWGDQATCTEGITTDCTTRLGAAGSGESPAAKSECARELSSLSCDGAEPASCLPRPGTLANMAPCRYAEQCQSQRCAIGGGEICGTCAPRLPEGLPCNLDSDCATSLECRGGSCRPFLRIGEACRLGIACREPLACKGLGLDPSSEGVCALRDPNDRTCGSGAPFMDCDASQGLVCETNQCVKFIPSPKVGEACLAGLYCNGSGACSGSQCAPIPRAGQRCQQHCLYPAVCGDIIGKSGDECVIPNPNSCK